MAQTYDVGVVFVHGIGDQAPGETVAQFGEPFAEYLVAREEAAGGALEVVRTDESDPAGESIDVRPRLGAPAPSWHLTEAHWADDFDSPTYPDLVRWALIYAPWLMQRDAVHWANREGKRSTLYWFFNALMAAAGSGGLFLIVGRAIVITALSYLLQLVLLVSLPFPRLLRRVHRALIVSVGDSFALVSRPDALRQMTESVDRALAATRQRCDTVIVVAHSQGAAVTHELLQRKGAGAVDALVTLGAGIRKLFLLRQALSHKRTMYLSAALRVAVLFAGVLLLVLGLTGRSTWEQVQTPVFWLVAVGVFAPPLLAYRPVKDLQPRIMAIPAFDTLIWHDMFTLADPVPGGQIDCLVGGEPRTSSSRVFNLSSLRLDHSAYQFNGAQVLSRIRTLGLRVAGVAEPTATADIERSSVDRYYRLRVLLIGRITGTIGAYTCMGIVVAHNDSLANAWGVALLAIVTLTALWAWETMFRRFHHEQAVAEGRLDSTWYPRDPRRRVLWAVFPMFGFGLLAVSVTSWLRSRVLGPTL